MLPLLFVAIEKNKPAPMFYKIVLVRTRMSNNIIYLMQI